MRTSARLTSLLLTFAVALGGCGKKPDNASPPVPADRQQAQTDQNAQDAAAGAAQPNLPKVDFMKPALALAAGSYSGACVNNEATKSNVTITVAPDGAVKMGDLAGTVTDKIMLGKHLEGAKLWYTLTASGGQADVSLLRHMDAAEHQVTANIGGVGVSCNTPTRILPLEGKTIFSAYAQLLRTKPRTIRCMALGDVTFKELPFALQDDKFSLGDQIVDLAKVTSEIVNVEGSGASYLFVEGDQRRGTVVFDEFGRLHAVSVTGADKAYACDSLEDAGK